VETGNHILKNLQMHFGSILLTFMIYQLTKLIICFFG